MSYQTGIATSREDLINKLCTFAVASGWTQDLFSAGSSRASLHKGNCYVHFDWYDLEPTYGKSIGMYQSLGYTGGEEPFDHPDDAGGSTTDYQDYQRKTVNYIGDGSFTAYHFFSHTDIDNVYVILEYAPGLYRHFGFGNIDKFGSWTGGEWVAGHSWHYNAKQSPTSGSNSVLLDGVHTAVSSEEGYCGGTIHMGTSQWPNQPAASKWGYVSGTTNLPGVDRASEPRMIVMGGLRKGYWMNALNWLRSDSLSGLINLVPLPIHYRQTNLSPVAFRLMGFMHNVYHVQMANFNPGDTITIGADDYMIFPMVRKRYVADTAEQSYNAGIAYKKVV